MSYMTSMTSYFPYNCCTNICITKEVYRLEYQTRHVTSVISNYSLVPGNVSM